jgi:hypothetical protein
LINPFFYTLKEMESKKIFFCALKKNSQVLFFITCNPPIPGCGSQMLTLNSTLQKKERRKVAQQTFFFKQKIIKLSIS